MPRDSTPDLDDKLRGAPLGTMRALLDAAEELPPPGSEGWPEPSTLAPEACGVPFPVDALPRDLARCVEALADVLQVPPDLPACLALGLLAGAVAGKLELELVDGWREPAMLWTCTVMRPGSRKSPVLAFLRAPLDDAERLAREVARREAADVERRRAAVEAQLPAAKGNPERAAALRSQLAELQPAPLPTLVASDVTPEAAAGLLGANRGRLQLADAEGVLFQHLTGLYREGGANLDVFLKGWSGERVTVHRRQGDPVDVPRALLSVALAVQPSVLDDARANRELAGRGILQRFLWSVPPDLVGSRDTGLRPMPANVPRLWRELFAPLLARPVPEAPATVRLTDDAERSHAELRARVERALRPAGDLGAPDALREWGAKLPGTAARLALVLHAARGEWSAPVSGDTMAGAVRLAWYFAAHAQFALAACGADPAERLARRLLRWLARYPERRTFRQREAQLQVNGPDVTAASVSEALGRLAELGYVRPVERAPDGRAGRPASPEWSVNPRWRRE